MRPMRILRPAVTLARTLLRRTGFEIRRRTDQLRLTTDAFFAQTRLVVPDQAATIFDLGANLGQTARTYLELYPRSAIHSFEPFPDAFRELEHLASSEPRLHAHRFAVAESGGTRTLHTNKHSATNSLLVNAATADEIVGIPGLMNPVGAIDVDVVTLDGFCSEHGIERIDILKMDIQGSELMALRGAEHLLRGRRIGLIYTEVLFGTLYEGQADFSDLSIHLRDRGYRLFGLYQPTHNAAGRLGWADAIFVGD